MRRYATDEKVPMNKMTRRGFMRTAGCSAAAGLAGAAALSGNAETNARRPPNIVVILADDLGFSDIGCYGSEIATPNLDGLAKNGVRFTHGYNVARCCPSRAALLTGLYPHQAGMGGMVTMPANEAKSGPYQGFLNTQCVTIAEVLRQAGYRTYLSGKWHVGERPEHWPRRRGFDRYFGLISGACSYWELLQKDRNRMMVYDDTPYTPPPQGFYMTDAFTEHALEFLDQHDREHREAPFFLYLAFTAPHWPLHAWRQDVDKYRDRYRGGWDALREERYARLLNKGIIEKRWRLSPRDPDVPAWEAVPDKEDWALRMAVYAAMVDRMDQGIGRVLDKLRSMGAEENTLVVFLADNGGCDESVVARNLNQPGTLPGDRGSFSAYERPWANASNTPFRLFKKYIHEGGIATPFVCRWPRQIAERGGLTSQVASVLDIMPTCLDAAGVAYPTTFEGRAITPVEGKSLLSIFRGKVREPHEALYWEHVGNRGVRHGKWKLVATHTGEWELYDIEVDRTELEDLSAAHPKRAQELHQRWNQWAQKCGVKIPNAAL